MFMKNITNRLISNMLIISLLMISIGIVFTEDVSVLAEGESLSQWDFEYTGDAQEFVVPSDGNYKLQLWGAEGGAPSDSMTLGGKGAYIEGHLALTKGEKLQVNVGGHPIRTNKGGFNGGGDGGVNTDEEGTYAGGGGGASDIRRYGNELLDRIGVAAGGGGGGIVIFRSFNTEFNPIRSRGSGGGAGGRDVGQTGGRSYRLENLGIDALYSNNQNSQGNGGSQIAGGKATDGKGNDGQLGRGGDGRYEPINPVYSVSGGGAGGYYGGSSQVVQDYYAIPNGGGGSSSVQKLERHKWSTGWEVQPSPNGGSQNGNSGHGYARITKSNDSPVIALNEKAEPGKNYNSESSIRYSGTIKDVDNLGGNMTIYSEILLNGDNYKQEHGLFKHSTHEQYFTTDVNIPYSPSDNRSAVVRFWAEDSEGLKSEVLITNILVSRPKDIKIEIEPETENWIRGSYKINLKIKSVNNIKNITTSSGKLNMTSTTNRKEQEGYIVVTENKPLTIRVADVNNNLEEKVFYVNNISDLEITHLENDRFNYKVNNWGDEHGLDDKTTSWEVELEHLGKQSYIGELSRNIKNMLPNEKAEIRYKLYNNLGFELVDGWTNYQSIYTLAEYPMNAEIINAKKDSVLFEFTPDNINVNKPRHIFKAIEITSGQKVSQVQTSALVNEGEQVTIRNLKPDTLYKLESATINGNGKHSRFKILKDGQGRELTFRTSGEIEIDYTNISDWNSALLKGEIKYSKDDPISVFINIGNKKIEISDDILADRDEQSFSIDIKKGKDVRRAKLISSPTDSIKIYEVTTSQVDGKYDVYMDTVVADSTEEHYVGWFGIDTAGPESKSKAVFKRITRTNGILTIDKNNIKDLSTANHEIRIDYGKGKMPLFSNKLITYDSKPDSSSDYKSMTIRLYDKLGNESILAWELDEDSSYEEGQDDNDIDTPEEAPAINTNNPVVEVDVPKGGTHMQTSLDGVTWSAWEKRRNTVKIALPTGDGVKTIFVRTGVESIKETPVYNVETLQVEMVEQKGGAVLPINNIKAYKFIVDLTAPKLKIRTMDNSLVAINGNITFLIDLVDNIDKSPSFVAEILKRDGKGILEKSAPADRKFKRYTEGETTRRIELSNFSESRTDANKLQPYTLKVTAEDAHGNRTVEHINFYVKHKK